MIGGSTELELEVLLGLDPLSLLLDEEQAESPSAAAPTTAKAARTRVVV
jgi:hypothetical protein